MIFGLEGCMFRELPFTKEFDITIAIAIRLPDGSFQDFVSNNI